VGCCNMRMVLVLEFYGWRLIGDGGGIGGRGIRDRGRGLMYERFGLVSFEALIYSLF